MSIFKYFGKTPGSGTGNGNDDHQSPAFLPNGFESGLGQQEYQNVVSNVIDLANPSTSSPATGKQPRGKRNPYVHYSGEIRAKIAKYAAENGNEKARKHFSKDFPDLKESTIRNFKKKYYAQLAEARKAGSTEVVCIPSEVRGRPPILMELDKKLLTFLKGIRNRGGVINIHVVRAVTHALITSNPAMTHLNNFDMPRSWVHSLYKRMGYTVRAGTTSRPPVPYGLYTENRYTFLSSIFETVEQYSIPFEMILNADQTPSSYVSVGKMTMAKRGEKSVPIKGLTDKRNITLTFAITFAGDFLPMQIIYGGKTDRSQPRGVVFPKGFHVTQNEKHWSNETETVNFIKTVINPYIIEKRKELGLPADQKALLTWDVFRGQTTDHVAQLLDSLNIKVAKVPANMTHFFQPLDLTVNGAAKNFMRKKFVTWYAKEVKMQIDAGVPTESIEVDLKLTSLKALHANWLIELYNNLTTADGRETVLNGWKKSGVSAVLNKEEILPPKDPFRDSR